MDGSKTLEWWYPTLYTNADSPPFDTLHIDLSVQKYRNGGRIRIIYSVMNSLHGMY